MINPSRLSPQRAAEREAQKAKFKFDAQNDQFRVEAIRHLSKSSSSGKSNFSLRPTEKVLQQDKQGSGVAMTSANNSSHALILENQLMLPNYTVAPVTAKVVEEKKVVLREAGKRAHLNRVHIMPLELDNAEKAPVKHRQIKSKISPKRQLAPVSEAPSARTPTRGDRKKAVAKSEISTQINMHGV
jgi:hypothetical protein